MKFPVEIWFNILKDTTLIELSRLMCVNRYFYNLIRQNKWKFVDNLKDKTFSLIPKTKATFENFKYSVDWIGIILKNKDNKQYIPDYVIEWIDDKQTLEYMCIYQEFSEKTISKIFDKINW